MGCWGNGIAQSDEFCEFYDSFLEQYDEGKDADDITKGFIELYRNQFDEDDGVWHDLYFAVAKALHTCGVPSAEIFEKVRDIIENGKNIEFFRELGATEKDLAERRGHLKKFWESLQIPRKNPRKRKKEPEKVNFKVGSVFWYRSRGKIRGALVLEEIRGYYLVVSSASLDRVPKTTDEILDTAALTAKWYCGEILKNRIHEVGTVRSDGWYNGRAGMYCGKAVNFRTNRSDDFIKDSVWGIIDLSSNSMRDMLKEENMPVRFEKSIELMRILGKERFSKGEEAIRLLKKDEYDKVY